MDMTRAEADRTIGPIHALTTKQRMIIEYIDAVQRATGEACPARLIARRLRVHHSTIQGHLSALYRKGWLLTPNAPSSLSRRLQ